LIKQIETNGFLDAFRMYLGVWVCFCFVMLNHYW